MDEYDRIAAWYADNRSLDVGLGDVQALAGRLPVGTRVLDLGCGTGRPIAQALLRRGFEVFGIDSSREMIARFRENCPAAHAAHETIQRSDFFATTFHAVIAWGVLFHLSPADQQEAVAKVSRVLAREGLFLFTAADRSGSTQGVMHGVTFRYFSLGARRYRALLARHGFEVLEEHVDDSENYVFVTRKLR